MYKKKQCLRERMNSLGNCSVLSINQISPNHVYKALNKAHSATGFIMLEKQTRYSLIMSVKNTQTIRSKQNL